MNTNNTKTKQNNKGYDRDCPCGGGGDWSKGYWQTCQKCMDTGTIHTEPKKKGQSYVIDCLECTGSGTMNCAGEDITCIICNGEGEYTHTITA